MTELTLRNPTLIDMLNQIKDNIMTSGALDEPESNVTNEPDHFLSLETLQEKMNDNNHPGHPTEYNVNNLNSYVTNKKIAAAHTLAFDDLIEFSGATINSGFLHYPPGGFIGWHTNHTNPGHQFIFSWSESGDGYFQYYDKESEQIVQLPDASGWQCRYFNFGSEQENHCWHSVYSNVDRVSICVVFRENESGIEVAKDNFITLIESEE